MSCCSVSCIRAVIGCFLVVLGFPVVAQVQLTSVGDSAGFLAYETGTPGSGVSAEDFDSDGDIDIFVTTGAGVPNQLYRNRGDGSFDEIAAEAGVDSLMLSRTALWLDYDGDHRLDLLVGGDCFQRPLSCTDNLFLILYRQVGDALFEDVTNAAGITEDNIADDFILRAGMSAGDINNDGYLDVILGTWRAGAQVLLNDGDGAFTDITASSGLDASDTRYYAHTLHDFDGDGWLDIHSTIDRDPDQLWINQKNNTFVNVAPAVAVDNPWSGMGTALGDYDNDGDIDIYVTNIRVADDHNVLYRNDTVGSTLAFTEVSKALGVEDTDWGWGCTFLDADNNGALDLAVTNGMIFPSWTNDPSNLFMNSGTAPFQFTDIAGTTPFGDTALGSSLIAFDYNRDGDLDMLQTVMANPIPGEEAPSELRLFDISPSVGETAGNFLVVKPRMEGPNHWAIGTVVRVEVGDMSMIRVITAGISFLGQEPAEAHFGVGEATQIDSVQIEWPDGTESIYTSIHANDIYTVVGDALIPEKKDTDGDRLLDFDELRWGTDISEADTDGDGIWDGDEVAFGSDPLDAESVVALPLAIPPGVWAVLVMLIAARGLPTRGYESFRRG